MSLVKRNILANFLSKFWVAIATYASIPFYLKLLGAGAYGLIGFNITLNTLISVLDLGFSITLNKELAKLSSTSGAEQESRDLVRTLEVVYWPIAILIGLALVLGSSLIARYWVHSSEIPLSTVQTAIMMMGVSVAIQWPYTLYQGGMLGLQRQKEMGLISAGIATLQNIGGVAALLVFGRKIEVYFLWQIFASLAITSAVTFNLWKYLPKSNRPATFNFQILKNFWKFSIAVMGSGIISLAVFQADKVVLSKILTLEELGNFTMISQVTGLVIMLAYPITMGVFPRMVQLLQQNLQSELSDLYHQSCQLISVLTMPFALLLCFFSSDFIGIMEKLTGRALLSHHVDAALSLFAVGALGNALINLPYQLQLSANWTSLWIKQTLISFFIQVPLLFFLGGKFGIAGCGAVYVSLFSAYLIFMIPLQHRRVLKGEAIIWYRDDFLSPILCVIGIMLMARLCKVGNASPLLTVIYLCGVWVMATLAACMGAPMTRKLILDRLRNSKNASSKGDELR